MQYAMELRGRSKDRDRGIRNPGTTCWLASCVHILNCIPNFRRALNCIETQRGSFGTPRDRFILQLQLALYMLREANTSSISINELLLAGRELYPTIFRLNEHSEAAECFYETLKTFENVELGKYDTHPLRSFFISTTESPERQKFYSVPLTVATKYFYDALQEYFFPHKGNPIWITEMPEVLVFNINRAAYDQENPHPFNHPKNCKQFEVLGEIALDRHFWPNKKRAEAIFSKPKPWEIFKQDKDNWSNNRYMLIAAVVHQGELANVGHYTAFVWDRGIDYILYDDEKVSRVSGEAMRDMCAGKAEATTNASLLVYMKKSLCDRETDLKEKGKRDDINDWMRSESLKRALSDLENKEIDRAKAERREMNEMIDVLRSNSEYQVCKTDTFEDVKTRYDTLLRGFQAKENQCPRPAVAAVARAQDQSAHNKAVLEMRQRTAPQPKPPKPAPPRLDDYSDDYGISTFNDDAHRRKRKAEPDASNSTSLKDQVAQPRAPKVSRIVDDYYDEQFASTSADYDDNQAAPFSMAPLQHSLFDNSDIEATLHAFSLESMNRAWSCKSGAPYKAISQNARYNAYRYFLDFKKKESNAEDMKVMYPEALDDTWLNSRLIQYAKDVSRMYIYEEDPYLCDPARDERRNEVEMRMMLRESLQELLPKELTAGLCGETWLELKDTIKKIIDWLFTEHDYELSKSHWWNNALFFSLYLDGDVSIGATAAILILSMKVKGTLRKTHLNFLIKARPTAVLRSEYIFRRYDLFLLTVLEHTSLITLWRVNFKSTERFEKRVLDSDDWMANLRKCYCQLIRPLICALSGMISFFGKVNVEHLRNCVQINEAVFGRIAALCYALMTLRVLQASRASKMQHSLRAEAGTAGITDLAKSAALVADLVHVRSFARALCLLNRQLRMWTNATMPNGDIAQALSKMRSPLHRAARNLSIAVDFDMKHYDVLPGEPTELEDWRDKAMDALKKLNNGKYNEEAKAAFLEIGDFSSLLEFIASCEGLGSQATAAEKMMLEQEREQQQQQ